MVERERESSEVCTSNASIPMLAYIRRWWSVCNLSQKLRRSFCFLSIFSFVVLTQTIELKCYHNNDIVPFAMVFNYTLSINTTSLVVEYRAISYKSSIHLLCCFENMPKIIIKETTNNNKYFVLLRALSCSVVLSQQQQINAEIFSTLQ